MVWVLRRIVFAVVFEERVVQVGFGFGLGQVAVVQFAENLFSLGVGELAWKQIHRGDAARCVEGGQADVVHRAAADAHHHAFAVP